jgi:hypothetical protein
MNILELRMTEEFSVDEEQLFFRRFPAEKQDQVRQLVGYAMLMGLSGKDLVSIGGKLDRLKAAQERKARIGIIEEMMAKCTPIGKDRNTWKNTRDPSRFNYVDSSGRKWKFEDVGYYGARVTSDTGVSQRFRLNNHYDVGRQGRYYMKQVLMHIYEGDFQLNF